VKEPFVGLAFLLGFTGAALVWGSVSTLFKRDHVGIAKPFVILCAVTGLTLIGVATYLLSLAL